jgi:hypothetical protein
LSRNTSRHREITRVTEQAASFEHGFHIGASDAKNTKKARDLSTTPRVNKHRISDSVRFLRPAFEYESRRIAYFFARVSTSRALTWLTHPSGEHGTWDRFPGAFELAATERNISDTCFTGSNVSLSSLLVPAAIALWTHGKSKDLRGTTFDASSVAVSGATAALS